MDARWHSETPGAIIDRLSILALKVHYMGVQEREAGSEALRAKCREKRERLVVQRADLTVSLGWLAEALRAGRKMLKLYRQFKAYNDPELNPYLKAKG